MTEFVVLIPARLDSSRLPGKALADIHGKPMVVRVAEQAAKSKAARVVVATDHPDIQMACQAHGVEVVMTSNRHESGTTRLAEAAAALQYVGYTSPLNMSGNPAMSVPLYRHNGLPVGTQFAAAHGREDTLLSLAAQLEQIQPWAEIPQAA